MVNRRVKIVLIIKSTFRECFIVGSLFHLFSHCSNSPIIHSIFHSDGSSFMNFISRDIFTCHYKRNSILFFISSRRFHGLKSIFSIESCKSFQVSISNHRNRTIAGHLIRFSTHQRPDRKFILLAVNRKH